jgi:ParB family chromosome partitioning protein
MSTTHHEFETTEIPLKKLLAWNENVRTTSAEQGIDELAASIASVGLLQSLVVRKAPRGKFSVIAGKRRLQGLSQLVDAGTVKPTFPVPCRIVVHDADLTEISLAENVQREPMHPADEFEAFQQLIANGKCVADVAARFGVTEAVVSRRLALARVSPTLLQKYREGEMNLELLQAFTLTDDHDTQEQIWNELQPWDRNPHTIRRLLSQGDIPACDKRVRFVGCRSTKPRADL